MRTAADHRRFHHKRDRLKQFRVFCHVARLGSITRAAEQLGLGQPTVSQQVRALEAELGARLFERNGPRIALAAAGRSLYRIAMPLVEGMDALYGAFAEQRRRVSGTLRIAAGQSSAAFLLPRFIHRFRIRHPDIRFRISRNAGNQAPRLLHAREVDLFFSGEKMDLTDTERYRVASFDFVLIAPPDHPLAGRDSVDLEEVSAYPAIVPASGTPSRKIGELTASRMGVEINVAVEAHGWGAIKRYVEAGLGVSIIPDFCLVEQDRVSVIPLPRHFRGQGYWMYASTDGPRWSPAIERFIRFVAPPPPRSSSNDGRCPGIDEDGAAAGDAIARPTGTDPRFRELTPHPRVLFPSVARTPGPYTRSLHEIRGFPAEAACGSSSPPVGTGRTRQWSSCPSFPRKRESTSITKVSGIPLSPRFRGEDKAPRRRERAAPRPGRFP